MCTVDVRHTGATVVRGLDERSNSAIREIITAPRPPAQQSVAQATVEEELRDEYGEELYNYLIWQSAAASVAWMMDGEETFIGV